MKAFKKWVLDNKYLIIGYFFIWIVPLILLIVCCTTHSSGKEIKFTLWGSVICVIFIIVYFVRLRKYLSKGVERELHEQNRIPVYLRICQMGVALVGFLAIIFALESIKEDIDKMLTLFISCACSVAVGYIFLIMDSYYRQPAYINRVKVRDSDK